MDKMDKSDVDRARKLSFFDSTIDESEHDPTVEDGDMKVPAKSDGENPPPASERKASMPKKEQNKSFMEVENNREKKRWLYMSELGAIFGDEKHTSEGFVKLFGSRETLYNVFKLFDVDGNDMLKQDQWIENIKGRFTDERQIDFAEQLESVAYVICGENTITFDKFVQIWNAKGIIDKFYRLIDAEGTNSVSTTSVIECISNITNNRPKTGFDKASIERLEQLFKKTVGEGNEICKEDFKKIVTSKNPFFTERVFQIFDRDNSGTISLHEFIDSVTQFSGQSSENKIKFLFKVYDIDGDGLIQREELQHVMRACMEENGMKFSDTQIDDLTKAMFDDADPNHLGTITYESLTDQLTKHGGLLENLSISIDRWLVPIKPEATAHAKKRMNLPHQLSAPYIKNNSVYLVFVTCFILFNLFLFVSRGYKFWIKTHSWLVVFARACGQCLNFNCAFVLVLMLRQTLTFLRSRGLGAVLPLDQHIYLHKLTGWLIVFYGSLHTLMHLINFSFFVVYDPVINAGNYTLAEFFFTSRPGLFGLVAGWANPTGFALIAILMVMFVCSLPFVRRGGSFEVFYWTHLLYILFFVLVVLHGPVFWKWFIIPGCIFIIERVLRFIWMRSDRGKTYVSSGIILPSKVINLVIKRPFHFCHRPGDYVFINIPQIAKYEWHPFTLSSAPEEDDHITLHIRAVGQWTNRLYEFFQKEQERLESGGVLSYDEQHQAHGGMMDKDRPMELYIKTTTSMEKVDERSDHAYTNMTQNMIMESEMQQQQQPKLKTPMEKAKSMPNMENRMKVKRMHDNLRSESETSFDHKKMNEAHQKNLDKAYDSPQNKLVAQSFRFMRNKPTIIAFKTPSLDAFEASKGDTMKDESQIAEEGKVVKTAVNFPVGRPLEIYIDGPYGAPSSHIFRAQHAVLIGTGIGVTPFASILQSIMHRYYKARHQCPRCEYHWNAEIPHSVMNLRKVDFFWINRDQRSFEWFVNLLSQLEIEQAESQDDIMERFLDMHMYITSALQKTDMKAVSLQLALDLVAEKEKRDLITGLKTRTIAGRPNWDKVFKKIQDQKKGKVTVFYCGPPQLAKALRFKCEKFGFMFRKEIF